MSLAWASRRPTSLLALAGEMSFIRELISTGNGSESAKCSQGSPSGKLITSGNRENDKNAAHETLSPTEMPQSNRLFFGLRRMTTHPRVHASRRPTLRV